MPQFNYEVFVSYAHLDNVPMLSKDGWVTQFTRLLDNLLSVNLGSKARIWRDNLMRGDDVVPETLRQQFPDIGVMVSILSPSFLNSDWCRWELEEFCQKAQATGGYRIGNKSRIYKINKAPIRDGRPPDVFDDLVGYDFFYPLSNPVERERTFGIDHGPEEAKNFLDRIGDVAFDISNLIRSIRRAVEEENARAAAGEPEPEEPDPGPPPVPAHGVVVYLCEPTPDLCMEHANVRRDLLERQYKVLPEYPLPTMADAFMASVREDLRRSDLSIHLVGQDYGEGPEGDILRRSHAHVQHAIAMEHERATSFPRLIWMPRGNKPNGAEQERFVAELFNAGTSPTTDLLQTNLESFKTVIYDVIKGIEERGPEPAAEPAAGGPRSVYIVCGEQDAAAAAAVDDYLLSLGYVTHLPHASGDEVANRRDHEEKLRDCDAVLIYWDVVPKRWLLTKLGDIRKAIGRGRARPLRSKAVFIAGERTDEKERFQARDGLVVRCFGEPGPDDLEAALRNFIEEIERGEEGDVRENY